MTHDEIIHSYDVAMTAMHEENDLLRELLWLRHDADHFAGLYGDDGEMHCGQCLIDFKRLSAVDIRRIWHDAAKQKFINATKVELNK